MIRPLMHGIVTLFGLCLCFSAAADASRSTPAQLAFNAGIFDVFDQGAEDDESGYLQLEYRHQPVIAGLRPFAGALVNTNADIYGFGGLRYEFLPTSEWVLAGSAAAGYYHRENGVELGDNIEFRSGVEIAYRFANQHEVGINFYHLSNAGLDDENPGAEMLGLHYAVPLTWGE